MAFREDMHDESTVLRLAREVGSRGITVNVVAPGFIDTDMTRELDDRQREAMLNDIPLKRLGQVEDIASAQQKKPNILVIWGDDVGWNNASCYNRGMMGYQTPNIDRVAREGMLFTDWYGQQSCTAGRAAFISGSVPIRSGMTKVGLPGAKEGWQEADVTMATAPLSFRTCRWSASELVT